MSTYNNPYMNPGTMQDPSMMGPMGGMGWMGGMWGPMGGPMGQMISPRTIGMAGMGVPPMSMNPMGNALI